MLYMNHVCYKIMARFVLDIWIIHLDKRDLCVIYDDLDICVIYVWSTCDLFISLPLANRFIYLFYVRLDRFPNFNLVINCPTRKLWTTLVSLFMSMVLELTYILRWWQFKVYGYRLAFSGSYAGFFTRFGGGGAVRPISYMPISYISYM
jgi:hypothetical protein